MGTDSSGILPGRPRHIAQTRPIWLQFLFTAGIFHMEKKSVLLIRNGKYNFCFFSAVRAGSHCIIQQIPQNRNCIDKRKGQILGNNFRLAREVPPAAEAPW